ncbi:MAG: hypothetical protein EOM64_03895 [Erysipelotrichia bacterium]|nr:hypothetical protein [Erysipelotrichia bacterium]
MIQRIALTMRMMRSLSDFFRKYFKIILKKARTPDIEKPELLKKLINVTSSFFIPRRIEFSSAAED